MKQRAAFLRTYMSGKEMILLDEPFSALDMITKDAIHEWFSSMVRTLNLTCLFVTHDVEEALVLSDRICILGQKPGTIIRDISIPAQKDADFSFSPFFVQTKKEIMTLLKADF